jgi:beta-galactosidase
VDLENRADFRTLDWLAADWELVTDAGPAAGGAVALPPLPPGGRTTVRLEGWPAMPPGAAEAWLTISFRTAGDEPWAPAGHLVGEAQLAVPVRTPTQPAGGPGASRPAREIVGDDGALRLLGLAAGPRLCLWRAPTDNDRIAGLAAAWDAWGVADLERRLVAVEEAGEELVLRLDWRTRTGIRVAHEQRIAALAGGGFRVTESVEVPAELADLARVGTVLELEAGHEALAWYGRGPTETYPDRRRAGTIGRWSTTVTDAHVPYVRPQENGGRADVRWLELRRGTGDGVRIELDRPRQVSASHFRAADLAAATHREELVSRPGTVVHIDAVHRGIGTASCGPDTLAGYLVPTGRHAWSWTIVPIEAAG